jgi:hypothetical protein
LMPVSRRSRRKDRPKSNIPPPHQGHQDIGAERYYKQASVIHGRLALGRDRVRGNILASCRRRPLGHRLVGTAGRQKQRNTKAQQYDMDDAHDRYSLKFVLFNQPGKTSKVADFREGNTDLPQTLFQPTLPLPAFPIIARNSRRVDGSVRKAPSMRLVTMLTPGLWTPRVVMHWCSPSITTATPSG